jgi:hypothetical protein
LHPNFCDEIYKFINNWDYKCTVCGERYESGLPPIDMVMDHIALHFTSAPLVR